MNTFLILALVLMASAQTAIALPMCDCDVPNCPSGQDPAGGAPCAMVNCGNYSSNDIYRCCPSQQNCRYMNCSLTTVTLSCQCSTGGIVPNCCGNGICESGENSSSCSADCFAVPPPPPPPPPPSPPPPPGCSCGSWSDVGCGVGSCSSGQMREMRSCNPSSCSNQYRCTTDSSCGTTPPPTCSCTAWVNQSCGGTCPSGQMRRTRTCVSNCASETQCVSHPACLPPPPPPPPVPPPPPPLPCGAAICGHVYKGDTGASGGLGNIVVELRDARGVLVQSATTLPVSGYYVFATPPAQAYISVAAGRNQSPSPSQHLAVHGAYQNFTLKAVPGLIRIAGVPSTFVLVTPDSAPSYLTPPDMNFQSGAVPVNTYSKVIGPNGVVTLGVERGSYKLTCWEPQTSQGVTNYVRTGEVAVPGGVVEPQNTTVFTVSCP